MSNVIAWVSVVAGVILFLAGIGELIVSWRTNTNVRAAANNAAKVGEDVNKTPGSLEEHAGIDFKGQWEALAALATALKDLDRSTRLLLLSLAFLAVAAASSGVAEVASAVAGS